MKASSGARLRSQNCVQEAKRGEKCEMSNCYRIHFHGQLSLKGRNLSASCINNGQRNLRCQNARRKKIMKENFWYLIMKARLPSSVGSSRNRLLITRPSDLLFLFISWNIRLIYLEALTLHMCSSRFLFFDFPRTTSKASLSSHHLASFQLTQYHVLETNKRLILENFSSTLFLPLSWKTMSLRRG